MSLSLYALAIETYLPMLRTLSELLDKGAEHAAAKKVDPAVLVNARLAPDMYSLAKQVQLACDQAKESTARLTGKEAPQLEGEDHTIDELKARIARIIAYLESVPESAFFGGEEREVTIPLPQLENAALVMNGVQFVRDWALAHFYFHVVTAYDILRHNGVELGKRDYMSGVARYIRTAPR